ncbi:MAG: isocitrate/isopropylmalate dehydrogenase family protein [Thermoprotei archaeon]
MRYVVAVIKGDGIGPEVTDSALAILNVISERFNLDFEYVNVEAGDSAIKKYGSPLSLDDFNMLFMSHAILKGPVGESAGEVVTKIRRGLDLFANIRPVKVLPNVPSLGRNVDMVIVRENTEDVYVRAEYKFHDLAVALRIISSKASERIAKVAFDYAIRRRKLVTIVHKANVLQVSDGLFRDVARSVGKEYPSVSVEELYVDTAVMDIVRRPEHFDVILSTNLYGDILSDVAAYVGGGLGLACSANLGVDKAMFEPVHGAAFDIAGKNLANPVAMIRSAGWMLKWLGEKWSDRRAVDAGILVEKCVERAFELGYRTVDLGGDLGTKEFTSKLLDIIKVF